MGVAQDPVRRGRRTAQGPRPRRPARCRRIGNAAHHLRETGSPTMMIAAEAAEMILADALRRLMWKEMQALPPDGR